MRRDNVIARILRALSGKTQEQIGEDIGVHPSLIAQFELGKALPNRDHLERMAKRNGLNLEDADGLLRQYETLQQPRHRQGESPESLLDEMEGEVRTVMTAAYQSLLRLPLPPGAARTADPQRAAELFRELEELTQEERLAVVQSVRECQTLELLQRVCVAAEAETAENREGAEAWARVAEEIAARIVA